MVQLQVQAKQPANPHWSNVVHVVQGDSDLHTWAHAHTGETAMQNTLDHPDHLARDEVSMWPSGGGGSSLDLVHAGNSDRIGSLVSGPGNGLPWRLSA